MSENKFLPVTLPQQWENYHRIKKTQIFDPLGVIYNPNHPSITANSAYNFILINGDNFITIAHIEFLNQNVAALRTLATDLDFQHQGYGKQMMLFLEQWLKSQHIKIFKLHSRLKSEFFYRKLGFVAMPFEDLRSPPTITETYIDLGKPL